MARIAWNQGKEKTSLDVFLVEYPPSKTWNPAGGDGWIWVRSKRTREVEGGGSSKSMEDAQKALDGLAERYVEIDENPKIPKVKSKKSGASKKMLRESAAKETERAIRDYGKAWPCGKWLFFEKAGYVDAVFATLARSIIDGPLSKLPNAKCHTIKAATADPHPESSNSSRGKEQVWLICLYFDVVWNVDHAKEVLECVVKQHGQIPNSVKADLYTAIGLDSNHPSKLRSTLYRPAEIINEELLKEWQAEYRVQSKRKADGDIDDDRDKENKKRVATNNHNNNNPIKPEDFWRASPDEEDGFEELKDTTPKEVTPKVTQPKSKEDKQESEPAEVESRDKSEKEATKTEDSDSDTEEEEIITFTAPPLKKATSSSPLKASPQKASPEKDTPEKEFLLIRDTSPPLKHTSIKPVVMKKRDRFGRSDF